MDTFQAGVIDALNAQDTRNQELLEQVIDAANAVSLEDGDVTIDFNNFNQDLNNDGEVNKTDVNMAGGIEWGGKKASLAGTGGVALLEFAKDAIQTAVSNVSGIGTNQIQARKIVERKMTA